jgi:16S rRNA G527 N7-methylase RsmG
MHATVTLIDRMGRRAGFLRNTLAILGLSGLEVKEAEIEKTQGDRFDMVVFWAFRPLEPTVYRALMRLLRSLTILPPVAIISHSYSFLTALTQFDRSTSFGFVRFITCRYTS